MKFISEKIVGLFAESNTEGTKPSSFFGIIGHEPVKQMLSMALEAESPVHILLVGPPGCAKTLFLQALMHRLKDQSYFIIGGNSTKAGMMDVLFERRPKYLLIDEIETTSKHDQTALLNLMETGILSETKKKRTRETHLKTWVFATSNSIERMLGPLLSRFVVLRFVPYTFKEFHEIATKKMTNEKVDYSIASEVAEQVWHKLGSTDFRDVVKVARMARNIDEVNWIIDTMKRYNVRP
jgi:Holliday junction DNA helicase RuvB